METVEIQKSFLQGEIKIPPSKSAAHRSIICAALAKGVSLVSPISLSKDIKATIFAVKSIGAKVEINGDTLIIDGTNTFINKSAEIDCCESGSTLRFLIPICAVGGVNAVFVGQGKLPERPIGAFLDLLPQHNVECESAGGLPLKIKGKLTNGEFKIQGNISSQYITGLLLSLPLLDGDSEIILTTSLESKAYVDMTIDIMKSFGVTIETTQSGYFIKGRQEYKPQNFIVEADWSQAGFFITAGAINGDLKLLGLNINSVQGDKEVVNIFKKMGADLTFEDNILYVKKSRLVGVDIDASQIPDAVPTLAVALAFAKGKSKIYGAERLRIKESDRIESTVNGLNNIGIKAVATSDGMIIYGDSAVCGKIKGYNDHRIVMSFSVAGSNIDGVTVIDDAMSVNKSYPDFFDEFNKLGGKANVISVGE